MSAANRGPSPTSPATSSSALPRRARLRSAGDGRARIVGSSTGGVANPNEAFNIGRGFGALIPIGAVLNPITGGNWEGRASTPDAETQPGKALDVAWRLALEAALAEANSADERNSIAQAIAALPK